LSGRYGDNAGNTIEENSSIFSLNPNALVAFSALTLLVGTGARVVPEKGAVKWLWWWYLGGSDDASVWVTTGIKPGPESHVGLFRLRPRVPSFGLFTLSRLSSTHTVNVSVLVFL